MKKTLLATTALAFIAGSAAAVDVEMYGQVNKGVFALDDGQNTDFVVVDNDKSSSRLGLKGAQALDNGLTASMLFEGELDTNSSASFVQNSAAGAGSTPLINADTNSFSARQVRVGLSGNIGGLYVGTQSTAFDGAIAQDLVGAQDVMDIDIADIGGALQFRNSTGGALSGGTREVRDFAGLNSQNRVSSVRYDSPILSGFQGRLSVAQGADLEGAVFYTGEMGDFKAAAAAGLRVEGDTNTTATNRDEYSYGGSVSVAHASGLAGTVGYTTTSLERGGAPLGAANIEDPSKYYVKAGYAWDAYEVAADYTQSEDNLRSGLAKDELTSMGLGAQYNLGNGVSLAGLYRNFDAEVTGASYDSIDLYGVNMRVKF